MPDPTPAILESARRFRQQLLARERRAASAMVRYYGDTWRRLQPEIRALQAEVDGMRAAGEDVSKARIGAFKRLQSIESQAQQELLQFTEYADDAIRGAEREAIAAAERDASALMRAAYPTDAPITIRFDRMPREAVENLVGFLQDGSPLADLLADAAGEAVEGFASTMVTGMAAGWNPRRLARALRSEFGMGLTQALKISRTEQLRAYRTTSLNAYRTSNVCTGWEWLATLSPRTCMACLEKDGTRYPLSAEFEDHVQGRCCPVPITKSYAEMGIDAPEPDFTREKGHDWFLRQDEGVQRGVLGDGKFDAWKDGQFKLEDVPKLTKSRIWGDSWTPKTLEELVPESAQLVGMKGE